MGNLALMALKFNDLSKDLSSISLQQLMAAERLSIASEKHRFHITQYKFSKPNETHSSISK